jgi:cysteine desulfurase
MRAGTVPVPLVVGFGQASEICRQRMAEDAARLASLRDALRDRILAALDDVVVNGHPQRRLPHNLNLSFPRVEGESVLMGLNRDVALSSGSACTTSSLEPSYVVAALGVGADLAHSAVRFGLHRFTTEAEVSYVAGRTIEVVERLRKISPLYGLAAREEGALARVDRGRGR